MGGSLRFDSAPAMWALERASGTGREILRVGQVRFALAEICSIERLEQSERDVSGLLVMAGLFLVGGTAFLFGVAEFGWRSRFLVGAVFLLALALVSLIETFSIRPVGYVRLRIATASGGVVFTTADTADAAHLEQVIASAIGGRRRGNV